jgi:hypothetical protein
MCRARDHSQSLENDLTPVSIPKVLPPGFARAGRGKSKRRSNLSLNEDRNNSKVLQNRTAALDRFEKWEFLENDVQKKCRVTWRQNDDRGELQDRPQDLEQFVTDHVLPAQHSSRELPLQLTSRITQGMPSS